MDKIARIRAELKRRREDILSKVEHRPIHRIELLDDLLSFLDTLSKEPDKGLDVTDFCKPIDPGIAQCVADHWLEMLDSKEPDKGLDEYASRAGFDYVDGIVQEEPGHRWNDHDVEFAYRDGIIAGAEWQASQMPMPEDTVLFQKGVAEGRRLEREDMLKDAVVGIAQPDDCEIWVNLVGYCVTTLIGIHAL